MFQSHGATAATPLIDIGDHRVTEFDGEASIRVVKHSNNAATGTVTDDGSRTTSGSGSTSMTSTDAELPQRHPKRDLSRSNLRRALAQRNLHIAKSHVGSPAILPRRAPAYKSQMISIGRHNLKVAVRAVKNHNLKLAKNVLSQARYREAVTPVAVTTVADVSPASFVSRNNARHLRLAYLIRDWSWTHLVPVAAPPAVDLPMHIEELNGLSGWPELTAQHAPPSDFALSRWMSDMSGDDGRPHEAWEVMRRC